MPNYKGLNTRDFIAEFAFNSAQGTSIEKAMTRGAASKMADLFMLCREVRAQKRARLITN